MIRSTQRAPRSCVPCTKRKIKCDKGVPCGACVARLAVKECRRETVLVRGQLRPGESGATYEDVVQENARLRALVLGQAEGSDGSGGNAEGAESSFFFAGRQDAEEQCLFERINSSSRRRSVRTAADVVMPSRALSQAIVAHAFQWSFWIHYALFSPEFERQHAAFWERCAARGGVRPLVEDDADEDPFWLATYFAVLAANLLLMDEDEAAAAAGQGGQGCLDGLGLLEVVRNWYEAALFFLEQGDFLQNVRIDTVRTVAILGVVFNNVGDVQRHVAMWSVALRQAQQLQLGVDAAACHQRETYVEQQTRRRLWWTLVLCEWIPVPHRRPCIAETDFACRLPDEMDDDELAAGAAPSRVSRTRPRAVRYHIAMIHVAQIYYRLHYKLRLPQQRPWRTADVAALVYAADEQLANLISQLPAYLRADSDTLESPASAASAASAASPDAFVWQKESLSLVLLYYRMDVSRLLQHAWLDGSIAGTRARAICLSSARSLIQYTRKMGDASKLRPWWVPSPPLPPEPAALTFRTMAFKVFVACAILAREASGPGGDFAPDIDQGIVFLQRIRPHNIIAEHGLDVLQSLLSSGHL